MAHPSQHAFCRSVIDSKPEWKSGVLVLDIGSLDINGNNRGLFDPPFNYTGVDVAPGPNVDVVCLGHEYKGGPFDVVLSTECLEHDPHAMVTMRNMHNLLRPGGLLLITCATTGRGRHGTADTLPTDNPLAVKLWPDWYHNITVADLAKALPQECFTSLGIVVNGGDLYFYGVKR